MALTCCGGGGATSLEGSAAIVRSGTGCDTTCTAGEPINLGNGVWRAQNASCGCVNAALQKASSGQTILVPAGNYDWADNYISISKEVKLIGAGSSNTVITGSNTTYGFFRVSTGNPGTFAFRLSGFKFITTANIMGVIEGAGSGWQIDNNVFEKNDASAMLLVSAVNGGGKWSLFGVIHSNVFTHTKIDAIGESMTSAEDSWVSPAQWGTSNALFIENNIFSMMNGCSNTMNSIDSNGGARMVIRYNTFNDARIEAHSAAGLKVRGTRSYEIYNNAFNRTCNAWAPPLRLRGGSHIIVNNVVSGPWLPSSVTLDNRRSSFDPYVTKNSQCTGAGNPSACCTGPGTGTCLSAQDGFGDCNGTSSYDTNIANSAHGGMIDGYRCLDQPGAGTGAIGAQSLDPVYVWNNVSGRSCVGGVNRFNACTSDSDCPSSTCSTQTNTPNRVYLHNNVNNQPYHIKAGRDYFDDTVFGYPNVKQVNGADWKPYTCPHPWTGLSGNCNPGIAGNGGYNQ